MLKTVLCIFLPVSAIHRVHADADFLDVRTRLEVDYTTKETDAQEKYFHESTFHGHYDGRFGDHELGDQYRNHHLRALLRSYISIMADLGVETWIMHGSLLGWWWNHKILPWDTDLDIQVTEAALRYLARYHNMTEHHFVIPHFPHGKTYLMEINSHFADRSLGDRANVIDARWIDTETGLFIDLTAVRINSSAPAVGTDNELFCKDGHHYARHDIFPLRSSLLENVPVQVPRNYRELLRAEYGPSALKLKVFEKS